MHATTVRFADLYVGQAAESVREVNDALVRAFADISGDHNPVHLDDTYAAGTFFKQRIAHGMLCGAFISALIASELPGPGSIYLSSTVRFKAPVFIDDTVTTRVEVTELNEAKKIVTLRCTCTRRDGTLVVEGDSLVKLFQ